MMSKVLRVEKYKKWCSVPVNAYMLVLLCTTLTTTDLQPFLTMLLFKSLPLCLGWAIAVAGTPTICLDNVLDLDAGTSIVSAR